MRKAKHILGLLIVLAILPSCELLDDCKSCRMVTYQDGEFLTESEDDLYCGRELREKEKEEPLVEGMRVTKWECY